MPTSMSAIPGTPEWIKANQKGVNTKPVDSVTVVEEGKNTPIEVKNKEEE